ncbi:transposase [Halomonas sp. AOP27-A1-41]
MAVEGILYQIRTVCQWRDLPDDFGHWNIAV